jgi:hypothetical protein
MKNSLKCNFCSKPEAEVLKLICGRSGVYICNECVEIASEICSDELMTEAGKKKRDATELKASILLKRLLKRKMTVYTLSARSSHARILIARGNEIIDITDVVCDLFTKDEAETCDIRDLSGKLFGSRRLLRRQKLWARSLKKMAALRKKTINKKLQDGESSFEKRRRKALWRVVRQDLDKIDPMEHEHLAAIAPRHAADYQNFGEADVEFGAGRGMDCSSGCKWYLELKGRLGADWGVCTNPRSHRCGLLTFEHQGCSHYEPMSKIDKLYEKVVAFVAEKREVFPALLQRQFRIGAVRAMKLIEALVRAGYVEEDANPRKARQVRWKATIILWRFDVRPGGEVGYAR